MSDHGAESKGPLAAVAEGFEAELKRLGYKRGAMASQLELLADLSRWLEEARLAPGELTDEGLLTFVGTRRREGRTRFVSLMGLATLLGYLRQAGVVPEPARLAPVGPTETLLERYWRFLVEVRGLAEAVVEQYETGARLFVGFAAQRGVELTEVSAVEVSAFVVGHCARPVKFAPPEMATILRSFLRFLYLEGTTRSPLAQAVPAVASWSASALPKVLPPGAASLLLRSCDRRTARGRRDYAILVLLSRLGLRAREVAAMRLEDFDWRAGEVVIHGKGRRDERLPVPTDVGEAVVDYLGRGRPESDCPAVFLRTLAPVVGLQRQAVSYVVYAACDRTGIPRTSAHRLRHTVATDLLRSGSSLTEIGQLLRHRSVSTTALYAKVDHEALAMLARPWPGGAA